jgi:DNA invertase Pin-like site-specific DNA recombinase
MSSVFSFLTVHFYADGPSGPGIAAAKARGKRLGRQPGQRPKADRLAPKVMALVAQGCSYRRIGREVGLSKNTVADIVKRSRTPHSSEDLRASRIDA